jgi:two-component system chemotaxis sensor kinase CheA
VDVQEVIYIGAEDRANAVHDVDGALIYRLRNRLLPLVDLAAQFHVEPVRGEDGIAVIVVETAGRRFGIVVDGIGDTTDVVVKPLTRATRSIRLFAGVAILSDGEPSLILDVAGLASGTGIGTTRADVADADADDRGHGSEDLASALLLASGVDGGRIAVEMTVVRRLEEIATESVERSGPLEVVQYRGAILPLLRVADVLKNPGPPAPSVGVLHTVVCESSIGLVGLVVGHIEDVVPQPAATPQPSSRRGVIASLVVDNRVTELLDVEALIADSGLGRTA